MIPLFTGTLDKFPCVELTKFNQAIWVQYSAKASKLASKKEAPL